MHLKPIFLAGSLNILAHFFTGPFAVCDFIKLVALLVDFLAVLRPNVSVVTPDAERETLVERRDVPVIEDAGVWNIAYAY